VLSTGKNGTLTAMRVSIFGALVAQPVNFPDEIEVKLFPLRSADCSRIGRSAWSFEERRTWDWLKRTHPIAPDAEEHIKNGEAVRLVTGPIVATLPDDSSFPEGCEYEIIKY